MRRLYKNNGSKRAFTLTEMIIVIGIIVLIASVVGVGIADIIKAAKKSDSAVNASASDLKNQINSNEAKLASYNF